MSNNTLQLPKNPTLQDFQEYVIKFKKIRDFKDDIKNALIFLFTEVGELGQIITKNWHKEKLSEDLKMAISFEMADVLIFLIDLANQYNIDLEEAFRKKEEINKTRVWNNS